MLTSIDLKAARKAKKLSQIEAAELIGVKRGTISSYESGKSKPSIAVIEQLCSAYGFNICLLNDAELAKMQRFEQFLGEFAVKRQEKGE